MYSIYNFLTSHNKHILHIFQFPYNPVWNHLDIAPIDYKYDRVYPVFYHGFFYKFRGVIGGRSRRIELQNTLFMKAQILEPCFLFHLIGDFMKI